MFEAKLDGLVLKKVLECLKDICTDVNFDCSSDGTIQLQAMDSSHVALVHLFLTEDFFHSIRCDDSVTLGVSVNNLLKALAPIKQEGTILHLSTLKGSGGGGGGGGRDGDGGGADDEVEEESLHIGIEDQKSGDSWEMKLSLLDIEKETLVIPKHDYSSVCSIDAKNFQELLKYLNTIADTTTIRMEKSSLVLSAVGDSISVTRRQHVQDIVCEERFEQEFAVRYLMLFLRGASLSDEVNLRCSPGIPLRLSFCLPDAAGSKRSAGSGGNDDEEGPMLCFYLAPKIDE